jgi:hypothetical protein
MALILTGIVLGLDYLFGVIDAAEHLHVAVINTGESVD